MTPDDFWDSVVFAMALLVPWLAIYDRTGSFTIPAILYLSIGAALVAFSDGRSYYWFIALGICGVICKFCISSEDVEYIRDIASNLITFFNN